MYEKSIFALCLVFTSALGDDYCSGYADQYGKWNVGFYCPTNPNEDAVYCCGTQTYKYCCSHRSQAVQTHTNHTTRTQLEYVLPTHVHSCVTVTSQLSVIVRDRKLLRHCPRILLKIVGLTCIVSVFLTILTCYVCKRYWKRSDSHDSSVYRVACTTSSPHVFPLESFSTLNPNAFLKSPESANICGDISSLYSATHQPNSQYSLLATSRVANAANSALCSYQHQSLSRHHRNHEPPPPYQLSVISGNTSAIASVHKTGVNDKCIIGSTNQSQQTVAKQTTTEVKKLLENASNACTTDQQLQTNSIDDKTKKVRVTQIKCDGWRRMSH